MFAMKNKTLKKRLLPILMIILVVGLLSACGNKEADQQPDVTNPPAATQEATPENKLDTVVEVAFPVTFTDAAGTEITIEKKPERIVSLMPSNTEITFALGAGDAVVGVSDFDNYPEQVLEIEKIGGMKFDVEKVLSLRPDLVLAHSSSAKGSEEGLNQFRDAGITVVMINSAVSIDQVYETIGMIAQATGTTENAEQIIAEMKATIADFEKKASEIKEEDQALVWVEVDPTLYTTGKGTFMHEMLGILHAKNAAGDLEGWVQFTEEDTIALNPDVIVTTYGDYIENPVELVYGREGWDNVNAIKNQRVFDVDADSVTRPGPRLTKGIEELAKAIYPEIFAK